MTNKRKTYAVKIDSGKIAIINGTDCSEGSCREYGCDFPECAIFNGEEFETKEEAKVTYPELELLY